MDTPVTGTARCCLIILLLAALAACGSSKNMGTCGGCENPYSVTGTVTGLVGTGLVLRDNGGDDLAVTTNGPFTFATPLATSVLYNVSVYTQPSNPSQTCVVSNAQGGWGGTSTVPTVTCTTDKHTIGGTVSGLSGTGLVLQDNGRDDQGISAAGNFRFQTPVASGASYKVTVLSEPSAPAQVCTVANGSGVVGATDVISVAVNCVGATAPVTVMPANANVAAGGSQQFIATVTGLTSTAVTWSVNGIVGGSSTVGTVSSSGLYVAPRAAMAATVTAAAQADSSASASASVMVLAPHRIGVRTGSDGLAELYDIAAGSTFTARGNNYIRLAAQTDFSGNSVVYHSTFNVGLYDAARSEAALATMQARGFNTVRVFLNGCCVGSIGAQAGGLDGQYIANVADFLARAKQHSIYVIFTQDWLPAQGGYNPVCPQYPLFDDVNLLNLCAGGVAASRKFQQDFVQALVAAGAALDAILAYELRNEYYYESSKAPLNMSSGTVTAANGSTYDMSDAASRQRMMDEGLVYFSDQVAAAIRERDPTSLVTVGFFWPQSPNPTRIGDTRLISVYPAMASSTADFVDIHGYSIPGDLNMDQLMQNYAVAGFQTTKPVIMGEFGAFQNSYALIGDAAAALKAWQIAGCPYHLRGWLLWTWDTAEQLPGLWTDQAGDGSIDRALAPASRPDPCVP
jgi:hypothetical protein